MADQVAIVVAEVFVKAVVKAALAPKQIAIDLEDTPGLLRLARGHHGANLQGRAVAALCNVARNDPMKRAAIRQCGGIPVLVELVRKGTGTMRDNAIRALTNLSIDSQNKDAVRQCGGISVLVDLLARGGTDGQRAIAIKALGNVVCGNTTNQDAVRECGGISVLVELARQETSTLRDCAARTLEIVKDGNSINQDVIRALNVAREGGGGLGPFCAQLVALARSGPTQKQNGSPLKR